jgi:hypothetical protein
VDSPSITATQQRVCNLSVASRQVASLPHQPQ